MRYATIKRNDTVNIYQGIAVSLFTQGCPHRCPGCWNPETWDFRGGQEISYTELKTKIFDALSAYNIHRDLSILGGEPLCPTNSQYILQLIKEVKEYSPQIKVYVWTGYELDELYKIIKDLTLLQNIDYLITGRYDQSKRDITLPLRGSSNQKVLQRGVDF